MTARRIRQININSEREALRTISEKLQHYTQSGNLKKAAIYQAKLEDKSILINMIDKAIHERHQ